MECMETPAPAYVCVVCLCVDWIPVVTLAIVLFDLQRDSKGVEVTVRRTGQCCVPVVNRPWGTPKGRGETVQDATDLDAKEKKTKSFIDRKYL